MPPQCAQVDWSRYDALLFDLDGVLTDTASLHAKAWKRTFDEFLRGRAEAGGDAFREFDIDADYHRYVDGKPRYDGVRDFLRSRGIELPEATPEAAPGSDSVQAVGNRKDELVNELFRTEGVFAFEGSRRFIDRCLERGQRIAVVTSSRNCDAVLAAAKLHYEFGARVDGRVAEARRLAGKPAPDTFLEAARALGVPAARAVVVEDAISGVRAGSAGGFGLVLGVARKDNARDLLENGADVVVGDLGELA